MIIIAKLSWPPEEAVEIGKRFKDMPALPAFLKMKGPFIFGDIDRGIQSLTLYEFDRAKLADAVEQVSARYVTYFGVPGLTYSINVWLDVGEALSMVGL